MPCLESQGPSVVEAMQLEHAKGAHCAVLAHGTLEGRRWCRLAQKSSNGLGPCSISTIS